MYIQVDDTNLKFLIIKSHFKINASPSNSVKTGEYLLQGDMSV